MSNINLSLASAQYELQNFKKENPYFIKDLLQILIDNIDDYFLAKGFSVKMRSIFRIMIGNDTLEERDNFKNYNEVKRQLDKLFNDYIDCYCQFTDLIRYYVYDRDNNIGYNKLVRLLFSEPIDSITSNCPGVSNAFKCTSSVLNLINKDSSNSAAFLLNDGLQYVICYAYNLN